MCNSIVGAAASETSEDSDAVGERDGMFDSGSGAIAAKDPRRSSKRSNCDLDSGLWRHSSQGPQEEQQEAEMRSTPGSGAKLPRTPGGVAKGGTGPSTLGSGEHAKISGGASGAGKSVKTPMKSSPRQMHRF